MFSRHMVNELALVLKTLPDVQSVGTYGHPCTEDGATEKPSIILVADPERSHHFAQILKEHERAVQEVGFPTATRIAATCVFPSPQSFSTRLGIFESIWETEIGTALEVLILPIGWHLDQDTSLALFNGIVPKNRLREIFATARPVEN